MIAIQSNNGIIKVDKNNPMDYDCEECDVCKYLKECVIETKGICVKQLEDSGDMYWEDEEVEDEQ